jgi:DNA-binding transcriptional regulator YdaS (Cro superfamily)
MATTPTPYEALLSAVDIAGSQSALARACGISQMAVWKWVQSSKRVSHEHVFAVEAATGVPRHLLRPDLYPADLPPGPLWIGYDPGGHDQTIVTIHPRHNGNRTNVLDKTALRRMAR